MSKEKIQVTIAPKSLAGFISSVIIRYRFNNRNQEPDEIVIPDEVNDLIPIKVVWPKDTATEELLYKYERQIKDQLATIEEQNNTVTELLARAEKAEKKLENATD